MTLNGVYSFYGRFWRFSSKTVGFVAYLISLAEAIPVLGAGDKNVAQRLWFLTMYRLWRHSWSWLQTSALSRSTPLYVRMFVHVT